MPYANNKGADQPAHPRSLISAFVVRCLDNIKPLLAIAEISSLYLTSVAEQASLSVTWSQTPKTGFLVTRLRNITINIIKIRKYCKKAYLEQVHQKKNTNHFMCCQQRLKSHWMPIQNSNGWLKFFSHCKTISELSEKQRIWRLKTVLSQCTCGISSIACKPETHPKNI